MAENFSDFSENALKVLEKRYLKKNDNGKAVEKPEDLLRRVAKNIAFADTFYNKEKDLKAVEKEFFDVMIKKEF